MTNLPTADHIRALTEHVDALPVECDGATRLVSLALHEAGIEYSVWNGVIPNGLPHWWVMLLCQEGLVRVDYRLRMWLGENAPHGVFLAVASGGIYSLDVRVAVDLNGARVLRSFCAS